VRNKLDIHVFLLIFYIANNEKWNRTYMYIQLRETQNRNATEY